MAPIYVSWLKASQELERMMTMVVLVVVVVVMMAMAAVR